MSWCFAILVAELVNIDMSNFGRYKKGKSVVACTIQYTITFPMYFAIDLNYKDIKMLPLSRRRWKKGECPTNQ